MLVRRAGISASGQMRRGPEGRSVCPSGRGGGGKDLSGFGKLAVSVTGVLSDVHSARHMCKGPDAGALPAVGTGFNESVEMDHPAGRRERGCFTIAQIPRKVESWTEGFGACPAVLSIFSWNP